MCLILPNILPKHLVTPGTSILKKGKEFVMYMKTKMAAFGIVRVGFWNLKNNMKYRAEFVITERDYTPIYLGSGTIVGCVRAIKKT